MGGVRVSVQVLGNTIQTISESEMAFDLVKLIAIEVKGVPENLSSVLTSPLSSRSQGGTTVKLTYVRQMGTHADH